MFTQARLNLSLINAAKEYNVPPNKNRARTIILDFISGWYQSRLSAEQES